MTVFMLMVMLMMMMVMVLGSHIASHSKHDAAADDDDDGVDCVNVVIHVNKLVTRSKVTTKLAV